MGRGLSATYKVVDMFGNEEVRICDGKKRQANIFDDYDGFVEKFEAKKTTDDCYTPPEAYRIALEYVAENVDLKGLEIVRPFYTGGDFEAIDYTEKMIVIDNPPFSIITKICRFYLERGVKFFLFAPHLTAFGSDIDCTHIIAYADITYENGATVKTSFVSNVFGDVKIIGDAGLCAKFEELKNKKRANLPKYEYPQNVLTVSKVSYCVEHGISLRINKRDTKYCRSLDSQKSHGKALFGSGFLLSEAAAREAAAREADGVIVWPLSSRELSIISSLGF